MNKFNLLDLFVFFIVYLCQILCEKNMVAL